MHPSLKKFIKYFISACMGLSVDLGAFTLLSWLGVSPAASHACSYTLGLIAAFFIQKHYVFNPKRKSHHAIIISLILWVIGLVLSTIMVDALVTIAIMAQYPLIAKVIVMGFTFWYNFFSRKFAFKD